jgi:hypothetical protein
MALPKISQPLFEITIPSTKNTVLFRPYLIKEEKILLMAKQGKDKNEILRAIQQIVSLCSQDTNLDVTNLTLFDINYIYLKLRAISVSNIVEVSYRDKEDGKARDFRINLDEVEILFDEKNNPLIEVDSNIKMKMRYPTASISNEDVDFDNAVDVLLFFMLNSIESIYTGEEYYLASDYTKKELEEFIQTIPIKAYDSIKDFFETMPKLYHVINYTNDKGTERKVELSSLEDFFTLG